MLMSGYGYVGIGALSTLFCNTCMSIYINLMLKPRMNTISLLKYYDFHANISQVGWFQFSISRRYELQLCHGCIARTIRGCH